MLCARSSSTACAVVLWLLSRAVCWRSSRSSWSLETSLARTPALALHPQTAQCSTALQMWEGRDIYEIAWTCCRLLSHGAPLFLSRQAWTWASGRSSWASSASFANLVEMFAPEDWCSLVCLRWDREGSLRYPLRWSVAWSRASLESSSLPYKPALRPWCLPETAASWTSTLAQKSSLGNTAAALASSFLSHRSALQGTHR